MIFEYKGFKGSAEYSEYDECYYGKLINTNDLVNYEAKTSAGLYIEFKSAVDDYIKFKEEIEEQ